MKEDTSSKSEIPTSPWVDTKDRREGIGQGFEVGLTLGSAYKFAKGYFISNGASSSRLRSGLTYARSNCLRTCGAVAGLFIIGDAVDNAMTYYRQKDDPLNMFASCAAVAAVATVRRGPRISSCSALAFGSLGALVHYSADLLEAQDKQKRNNHPDPR